MMKFFHLDESVRKKALEMCNRSENEMADNVNSVRNWMKTQPHLPEIMEDKKIESFLLFNKCSVEKAKKRIEMYYTVRSAFPEFYEESNPKLKQNRDYFDVAYTVTHPALTKEMYRVTIFRMKEKNKCSPLISNIYIENMTEVRLYEDCALGDIVVFDMTNVTVADVARFTPSFLAQMIAIYKLVYPSRLRRAYIINSSSYITSIMNIVKLFLKPKIFERIHVHQGSDVLSELFSNSDLPKDYGGEGPSLEEIAEMWKAKLNEYQDRFDKLDELRVNEALRPKKLKDDDILGFYGNFRKIEID